MASTDSVQEITMTVHCSRDRTYKFALDGSCWPTRVASVSSSSPAYRAGLMKGDFLLTVNGREVVRSPAAQVEAIISYSAGSPLTLKIARVADHGAGGLSTVQNKYQNGISSPPKGSTLHAYQRALGSALGSAQSALDILGGPPPSSQRTAPRRKTPDAAVSHAPKLTVSSDGAQEVEVVIADDSDLSSPPSSPDHSDDEYDPLLDFTRTGDSYSLPSANTEETSGGADMLASVLKANQALRKMKDMTESLAAPNKYRNKPSPTPVRFNEAKIHVSAKPQASSSRSTGAQPVTSRSTGAQPGSSRSTGAQPGSSHSSGAQPGSSHSSVLQTGSSTGAKASSSHSAVSQPGSSHSAVSQPGLSRSTISQADSTHSAVSQPSFSRYAADSAYSAVSHPSKIRQSSPPPSSSPPHKQSSLPDQMSAVSLSTSSHTHSTSPERTLRDGNNGRSGSASPPPPIPPYTPSSPDRFALSNLPAYQLEVKRQRHTYEEVMMDRDMSQRQPAAPRLKIRGHSARDQLPVKSHEVQAPEAVAEPRSKQRSFTPAGSSPTTTTSTTSTTSTTTTNADMTTACRGLPGNVHTWKPDVINKWLLQLNPSLHELYGSVFMEHNITGHSLLLMNQSKLRSIGVTNKDHRLQLGSAVARLRLLQEQTELKELSKNPSWM